MASQEFTSKTPAGTVLQVLAGPNRAVATEFSPGDTPQMLAVYAGKVEKLDDPINDVQATGFKPFMTLRMQPPLDGVWLAAWQAYKMTFKFLCKDNRELEGQPPPKVDLHTLALAQGLDKTEFIKCFDALNEQFTRMGGYPIYRPEGEDFIVLGWKKREFILDNSLTEQQVADMHERNDKHMRNVRATYS